MRIETTESKVKAVEFIGDGKWAVRWDLRPKLNENGQQIDNIYWYEEHLYNHIPQIEEIKELITFWHNKQIDGAILNGHTYKGINVLLSAENQANFKALFDRATQIENAIKEWDNNNPELAGKNIITEIGIKEDGTEEEVYVSTTRPESLLPITFKLGTDKNPNYYKFTTIEELTNFYDTGLRYIQSCYLVGWTQLAQFNWGVYADAIAEL